MSTEKVTKKLFHIFERVLGQTQDNLIMLILEFGLEMLKKKIIFHILAYCISSP